jgi:hypothetical protein
MRAAHDSVDAARAANRAMTLCHALAMAACPIALLVGDLAAAEHYVEMLLDHSVRHALARWRAFGRSCQTVLVMKRGDPETGLWLLRAGVEKREEARSTNLRVGTSLGDLAEAWVVPG